MIYQMKFLLIVAVGAKIVLLQKISKNWVQVFYFRPYVLTSQGWGNPFFIFNENKSSTSIFSMMMICKMVLIYLMKRRLWIPLWMFEFSTPQNHCLFLILISVHEYKIVLLIRRLNHWLWEILMSGLTAVPLPEQLWPQNFFLSPSSEVQRVFPSLEPS